ncbi:restriction endonuclease subunit S [Bacillus smithii]|uniref:restriction endonuclease subunit S n=1 Tax=Bacillus smithii TaxID=1479 RepID=UPI003D1BA969
MTSNDWKEVQLKDVILFNPRESIKKGTMAKKISMDKLAPYQKKITGFDYAEFKSGTKFKNGDTLLARITPCLENGKTAQVDILDDNEIGFGSTEFIVMREISGISVNDFIYYLAISDDFRNIAIKSMTGTSGRQRVQMDVLEQTKLLIPPLREQKAIANILSTLDEKIETNNQINEKLEEMAQALFKHWFVDFEFPNENGEPYKSSGGEMVESELGMIPKGWEVDKLSSIAEIVMGQSPKSDTYNTDKIGLPLLNGATDFQNKNLNPSKYTSDPKKVGEKGDFVFGVRATIGLVTELDGRYAIGRGVGIARAFDNMYKEFLYEVLNIAFSNFQYTASGSVYLNVSKNDLEDYKLVIPDINILRRYHKITKSILNQKENVKRENAVLEKLRNTLLPKLMSGEIRVPLDNNEVDQS